MKLENDLIEEGSIINIKDNSVQFKKYPINVICIVLGYALKVSYNWYYDKTISLNYDNLNYHILNDFDDTSFKFLREWGYYILKPIYVYGKNQSLNNLDIMEIAKKELNKPLDDNSNLTFFSLSNVQSEYITNVPNLSKYLMKMKLLNGLVINNLNYSNLLLTRTELLDILKDIYNKKSCFLPNQIKFEKTDKVESRHFYLYKSDKVVRLYYCITKGIKDDEGIFCLVYNTSPTDPYLQHNLLSIVKNSNNSDFLMKYKTKKFIVMDLKKKDLSILKGLKLCVQYVYYTKWKELLNLVPNVEKSGDILL